jgi:hypothetical protein
MEAIDDFVKPGNCALVERTIRLQEFPPRAIKARLREIPDTLQATLGAT